VNPTRTPETFFAYIFKCCNNASKAVISNRVFKNYRLSEFSKAGQAIFSLQQKGKINNKQLFFFLKDAEIIRLK
jgi:hypothetical protein